MTSSQTTGVLFVCLGNICRSPLAKAVFTRHAQANDLLHAFDIDSCGTGGWHAGEPADPRSVAIARKHDLPLPHSARQLDPAADFPRYRWIIAMDAQNQADLLRAGAPRNAVHLLRSFDPTATPHDLDVPDPYYGGDAGFQTIYDMLNRACAGLVLSLASSQPSPTPSRRDD